MESIPQKKSPVLVVDELFADHERGAPRARQLVPAGQDHLAVGRRRAGRRERFGAGEAELVDAVVAAAHDAFAVDRSGRVVFEGERIARLARGKEVRTPAVVLDDFDAFSAGARQRIERRLVALGDVEQHQRTPRCIDGHL